MALSLHPQAIIHCLVLVPSSVGLWAVLAVIALMMAAESMPPTPPPVAESFVTVVVDVTDETCRDGDGDDGDEACQVWGRSDLMGRCTSLCDVVMGGWRWAEMAVIAKKKWCRSVLKG